MKKSNKGFSLVELIIVIAIMAILAGALAPALVKYINKTRLSSDIANGQTVAKAIQAAMSNEAAFNAAPASFSGDYDTSFCGGSGNAFYDECVTICDPSKIASKAKKDMKGGALTPGAYKVEFNLATNVIKVTNQDGKEIYPDVDKDLTDK